MAHELTDEQWAAIKAALTDDNKIEAIKRYRDYTGEGLLEAKQAVEKLETELRKDAPEHFKTKEGKGCGSTALLALAAGACLSRIIFQ